MRPAKLCDMVRGPNSAGVRGREREPARGARGLDDSPVRTSARAPVVPPTGTG